MDQMLFDALKALVMIIGTVGIILVAPLIFMMVFSLVTGFNEPTPDDR